MLNEIIWIVLIILTRTEAITIKEYLDTYDCQPATKDLLLQLAPSPDNVNPKVWNIVWNASSNPKCTNAFELASSVLSLSSDTNSLDGKAKEVLDLALASAAYLPSPISLIEKAELIAIKKKQEEVIWNNSELSHLLLSDLATIAHNDLTHPMIVKEYVRREAQLKNDQALEIAKKFIEHQKLSDGAKNINLELLMTTLRLRGELTEEFINYLVQLSLSFPIFIPELARLAPSEYIKILCSDSKLDDEPLLLYHCLRLSKEQWELKRLEKVHNLVFKERPDNAFFTDANQDAKAFLEKVKLLAKDSEQLELLNTNSELYQPLRDTLSDLIFDAFANNFDKLEKLIKEKSGKYTGQAASLLLAYAQYTFDLIKRGEKTNIGEKLDILIERNFFLPSFESRCQGQQWLMEHIFTQIYKLKKADWIKLPQLQANLSKRFIAFWLLEAIRNRDTSGPDRAKALQKFLDCNRWGKDSDCPDWKENETKECCLNSYVNVLTRIWSGGGYTPLRTSVFIDNYDPTNFKWSEAISEEGFYKALDLVTNIGKETNKRAWPPGGLVIWRTILCMAVADRLARDNKPEGPTLDEWKERALQLLSKKKTIKEMEDLRSKYVSGSEPPHDVPVGLHRVRRELNPPHEGALDLKFKVPNLKWPFKGKITPDCLIRVIGFLEEYRHGVSVAALIGNLSGILYDGIGHFLKVLWPMVFNHVNTIEEMDAIVSLVPKEHCDSITNLSPTSSGWMYLCESLNTNRTTLEERRIFISKAAEFLQKNAQIDYPHQGLAFLLLDLPQQGYKKRLGNIYTRYAEVLKDSKLDDLEKLDQESATQFARYEQFKLLREIIIERLYASDPTMSDYSDKDVNPLLTGLGRYIFDYVTEFAKVRNSKDLMILYSTIFGDDAANATRAHWEKLFKIVDANEAKLSDSEILSRAFGSLKESDWGTLIGKHFKINVIVKYIEMVRRNSNFLGRSALELSKKLGGLIKKYEKDCENKDKDELLIMVRILDLLADGKNEELGRSLFEAIGTVYQCFDLSSYGNPLERVRDLLYYQDAKKFLSNPTIIAASLFSKFTNMTPESTRDLTLRKALQSKTAINSVVFQGALEKYIFDVILKRPFSAQNAFFITKYTLSSDEQKFLKVLKFQHDDLPFIASLHLRVVLGKDGFDLVEKYLQDTPLPDESKARVYDVGDPNALKEEYLFAAILRDAILDPDKLKNALEQTKEAGIIVPQFEPIKDAIPECGGLSFEQVKRYMEPKEIFETKCALKSGECYSCFEKLDEEKRRELLSVPRIFEKIADKLTAADLKSVHPILISSLTRPQLETIFQGDNCSTLAVESIVRQVHYNRGLYLFPPQCIQMAGPNWLLAFIPSRSFQPYPDPINLAKILTKDNFHDLNEFLFAAAYTNIPAYFWRHLGEQVEEEAHPCKNMSSSFKQLCTGKISK